ncbi:hypothetical protein HYV88_01775 [Candidatus Woesearchaeota archaeon]|nr:hypothetical protein [Candidatus Woesearchaeota archaeon]
MFKKGQVSISVVIGVVLLILIGMLVVLYQQGYFSRLSEVPKSTVLKGQAEDVKVVLGQCFKDKFLQAVYMVGLTGGHLATPNPRLNLARGLDVGYGYFLGGNELPNREEVELEISDFLNFAVPDCLNSIEIKEFTIVNSSVPSTRVNIYDNKVEAKLSYNLVVSKEGVKYTYDNIYDSSYDIRLGRLHKFALDITNKEIDDPDFIPFDFIENFIDENGVLVDIIDIDGNTDLNVYVIYDEKSNINGVPYVFEFANKFS